jgi:2'-5' RNA ligase
VRLFVAVEIEAAVAQTVTALVADLRAEVSRIAPRARLTWVSSERLHFTLAFIGQVDAARLPPISAALRPPFSQPPFDITVHGLGTFPERGRPRVLWAGVNVGREAMVSLATEVAARLRGAGVSVGGASRSPSTWLRARRPDAREESHQPHLTLARVRDAAGLRASALLAGRGHVSLGTTHVGAITLFESRLSPAGSTYTAMARMSLNGFSGQ